MTSFFCGSRCRRKPTFRSVRTASCAAATEDARPTVIGEITPGNSTVLRIGMMISASSGSGFNADAARAASGVDADLPASSGDSIFCIVGQKFMKTPSC